MKNSYNIAGIFNIFIHPPFFIRIKQKRTGLDSAWATTTDGTEGYDF